jgi:hypothetical protein
MIHCFCSPACLTTQSRCIILNPPITTAVSPLQSRDHCRSDATLEEDCPWRLGRQRIQQEYASTTFPQYVFVTLWLGADFAQGDVRVDLMENSKEFESLFFETKKVDCARDVFKPFTEAVCLHLNRHGTSRFILFFNHNCFPALLGQREEENERRRCCIRRRRPSQGGRQ